jgi:hypothetical protein
VNSLIDAQCAHHFPILRGGPHQAAEAGASEREVQHQQHSGTGHDQEQVVSRQMTSEYLNRSAQPRRAWSEQILRAPQPKRGVIDHENQRERGEQLEEFGRAVHAPKQEDFDQRPDCTDDESGCDNSAPEADDAPDMCCKGIGDIGPEHIKGPMRDVDDAGNSEDQRQPNRDKKQARRS